MGFQRFLLCNGRFYCIPDIQQKHHRPCRIEARVYMLPWLLSDTSFCDEGVKDEFDLKFAKGQNLR